jgi:hypothetical protein
MKLTEEEYRYIDSIVKEVKKRVGRFALFNDIIFELVNAELVFPTLADRTYLVSLWEANCIVFDSSKDSVWLTAKGYDSWIGYKINNLISN